MGDGLSGVLIQLKRKLQFRVFTRVAFQTSTQWDGNGALEGLVGILKELGIIHHFL